MRSQESSIPGTFAAQEVARDDDGLDLAQAFAALRLQWRPWLGATFASAVLAFGATFLVKPEFTSTTTILPPQMQQSAAASALQSLGALSSLAGGAGASLKSPADEYVALMESVTVSDRMIDRFGLMARYDVKYRRDARKKLGDRVQIVVGKKDGLINISVDDFDPVRAAAMANQYVEELRRMTSSLAISEAQQRRQFFEKQMDETKQRLVAAQSALQGSGFDPGAIKAQPAAAVDEYAHLRAQLTASEVRLQSLRESMTENAPAVRAEAASQQALRGKVEQLEQSVVGDKSTQDYVGKLREFKYQESLLDIMVKQYELARIDESREGALIQVVDPALPAELKSKPRRTLIALGSALVVATLLGLWLVMRDSRVRRRSGATE